MIIPFVAERNVLISIDHMTIELDCNKKIENEKGEKTPDPTEEIEF